MSTPLGLARQLRLSFPEFIDVSIVREGPGRLHAYCAVTPGLVHVPADRLRRWVDENRVMGVALQIEQVATIPAGLEDDEVLLRRTKVSRVIAETANVSSAGLRATLRGLFPDDVVELRDANTGRIDVIVRADLPVDREEELRTSVRVLMACDPLSIEIERQAAVASTGTKESSGTLARLAEDRERLHEAVADALAANELPLPSLPDGSSTYGSVHDGIETLLQRLALFDRVYVYMPFSIDDFPQWVGSTFNEFIDVLPTGRVVPVFGQRSERYEPGLISQILDAGAPRVVLQGEHALRMARNVYAEHPLIGHLASPEVLEARSILATSSEAGTQQFLGYLDALVEVARGFPSLAVRGESLATAVWPIASWLDGLHVAAGLPSRGLEMAGAIEHRAITESLGGVPMSKVGHYFDSGLRWVYGADPGDTALLRVPEPDIIGRICFPDMTGLTPKKFVDEFSGPRVIAMRELMASRRVQTADGSVDLVNAFNEELKLHARRTEVGYYALATLLTAVGAFTMGLPLAVAGLSLDLARRVVSRKAPNTFATLTSVMTATTREAALFARVKNG